MTYKLPSQFTAFQNAMEGNRIKEAIALLKEIEGTIRDSGFKIFSLGEEASAMQKAPQPKFQPRHY